MKEEETKHQKFKRIVTKRVKNTIKDMDRVINCSNTNTYYYTKSDVNKITKALSDKINEIKGAYNKGLNKNNKFSL
tara:strand:- start:19806 stop:20033 length:228 start_codon:yes stop_codon:yes gene_type:complete